MKGLWAILPAGKDDILKCQWWRKQENMHEAEKLNFGVSTASISCRDVHQYTCSCISLACLSRLVFLRSFSFCSFLFSHTSTFMCSIVWSRSVVCSFPPSWIQSDLFSFFALWSSISKRQHHQRPSTLNCNIILVSSHIAMAAQADMLMNMAGWISISDCSITKYRQHCNHIICMTASSSVIPARASCYEPAATYQPSEHSSSISS